MFAPNQARMPIVPKVKSNVNQVALQVTGLVIDGVSNVPLIACTVTYTISASSVHLILD